VPIPVSDWERLHRDPTDIGAKMRIGATIADTLRDRLMGMKKIEQERVSARVILRRTRLQYESHVEVYTGGDRHGFDVTVPSHGFEIRITCPRVVPRDVVGAPWDDLLENLCKIDRSVIRSRKSRSRPLTYTPRHGKHPALRVEVLSRETSESLPQPPPPPPNLPMLANGLGREAGDSPVRLPPPPPEVQAEEPESRESADAPRPIWKDPIVVMVSAVNALVLIVFLGYLAWTHNQTETARDASGNPRAVMPGVSSVPPSASPNALVANEPNPTQGNDGQSVMVKRADPSGNVTVYVNRDRPRYHKEGCPQLAAAKIPMLLSEVARELAPCRECWPLVESSPVAVSRGGSSSDQPRRETSESGVEPKLQSQIQAAPSVASATPHEVGQVTPRGAAGDSADRRTGSALGATTRDSSIGIPTAKTEYRSSARARYRTSARKDASVAQASNDSEGSIHPSETPYGTTATGIPTYMGPRGGIYHYSASGRKVYERRR
jgi:hypothetical protein